MLSSLWSARWYLLLGLLTFLLTLIIYTPLHFVWQYAQPYSAQLPIQIKSVSGTLWNGQAKLQQSQLGDLSLNWQLQPLALLTATAKLQLEVNGDGVFLDTGAELSLDQQLTISGGNGYLSTKHLVPVLRQARASLQGEFEMSGVAAKLNLADQKVEALDGRLTFSGGDVSFPVDGRPINATLPLLVGNMSRSDKKTLIDIHTDSGDDIGQAFLQADGWGGIAIRRRFLDILGQRWPGQEAEDEVIFEASRKIL